MIYRNVCVWILVPSVILPSWSSPNNGYQNSNFIFQKQIQDKIVWLRPSNHFEPEWFSEEQPVVVDLEDLNILFPPKL